VSQQDSQFFSMFSLVIGLLVAVAIVIFAIARAVGNHTQLLYERADAKYEASVAERVRPLAREAIAGADNSAMAIQAPQAATPATGAMPVPKNGAELFETVCKACHGTGLAGAPKAGDKAAWAPRIAQGKDMLYLHALKGFTGEAGVMPAKGGRVDLTDDLVKQGVDYMSSLAK
jgi:cytochrome c5